MAIGNVSLLLDLLNATTTYVSDLSGADGASTRLEPGGVYTLQAMTADVWVGFGATQAAAQTDCDATKGEKIVADAPPRICGVSSTSAVYIARNGVAAGTGTLRIRRCQTS
jgi:hypothetical protein